MLVLVAVPVVVAVPVTELVGVLDRDGVTLGDGVSLGVGVTVSVDVGVGSGQPSPIEPTSTSTGRPPSCTEPTIVLFDTSTTVTF